MTTNFNNTAKEAIFLMLKEAGVKTCILGGVHITSDTSYSGVLVASGGVGRTSSTGKIASAAIIAMPPTGMEEIFCAGGQEGYGDELREMFDALTELSSENVVTFSDPRNPRCSFKQIRLEAEGEHAQQRIAKVLNGALQRMQIDYQVTPDVAENAERVRV